MPGSQKTANRMQHAERIDLVLDSIVCKDCGDICWEVEVWLRVDSAPTPYKTCVLHRGHLSQGQALRALGSWSLSHARILSDREAAAYLLEHQMTIW